MPHILVVEDNPMLGKIYEKALLRYGYETFFANTLELALRMTKRLDPELITLDWHIGEFTPEILLEGVNRMPETMRPPVLVITGDTLVKAKPPINHVLEKPISIGKLVETVITMLQTSPKQPYEEIRQTVLGEGFLHLKWSGRISANTIRAHMIPEQATAHTVIFDITDLSFNRFRMEDLKIPQHPPLPHLERVAFVCPPDVRDLSYYLIQFLHKTIEASYYDTLEAAKADFAQRTHWELIPTN